jgi:hypothetical protein
MYFGFRFMYLMALGFYALAFAHWVIAKRRVPLADREADRMITPLSATTIA